MIQKIFFGEMRLWSAGGSVAVLDLPEYSSVQTSFFSSFSGKTIGDMKALWAQKVFSGRAAPPKLVNSDAKVKKIVAENQNALKYINASSLNDCTKAVPI